MTTTKKQRTDNLELNEGFQQLDNISKDSNATQCFNGAWQ